LAVSAQQAWGEHFTLPWFKVALTGLVFAMALSFLGVWEIPIPGFVGTGRAGKLQAEEGPGGAFFKGVFTTILATPCSGPFLGPLFAFLLKQPPYVTYLVFGAVGLGMASPYLIVGAFPKLIRFLPKPGAWMETFQQLMGFLLLATVVYLFWTMTSTYFVPTLTLLLVGLWPACWWIGRTPLTQHRYGRLQCQLVPDLQVQPDLRR
jgi:thiol:disulfide interchange protein